MATILDKELTRETTVVVKDRVIQITLTDKQTISMKLKGMKSGSVEISIADLYKQLTGEDSSDSDVVESKPVVISHETRNKVNGNEPMISLHALRTRANIRSLDYPTKALLDSLFNELVNESKR